ncbi:MAG: response regulator [Actinobacteria bacterium]|nr:response regulator [Actinomycetota bacterium]MBU1943453.1 response regulator [Actinomycetota bacterium]MBU2686810.1 response regulator [Actinomycetota bacterium]
MSGTCIALVVDDDESIVRMLRVRLEAEGYEAVLALDGVAAVELAVERHPDVILLDIAMPSVTGVDVLDRLEASDATRGIPVLVITAYTQMIDSVKGYDAVKECFVKPFDMPSLMSRIREVTSRCA